MYKEDLLKEIMHFHYMIIMATPQHKNPCLGEIYQEILLNPSLVIFTIYTVDSS